MNDTEQLGALIALINEMATASQTGIAHDWHADVELFAQELLFLVAHPHIIRV